MVLAPYFNLKFYIMFAIVRPNQKSLDLQARCEAAVREYIDKANKRWPKIRLAYPTIRWDLMGTTAGLAHTGRNLIQLHPFYLAKDPEDYIPNTAGHEVAHLVARNIHLPRNINPHGDEWAQVMWTFKLPAIRCHRYNKVPNPKQIKAKTAYKTEDGIVRPVHIGKIIEFD